MKIASKTLQNIYRSGQIVLEHLWVWCGVFGTLEIFVFFEHKSSTPGI